MKLNAAEIEVESEGFTSTGFSLEVDDPQIIEILTQKIYTDPYVFPRELMANAIDSGGIAELLLPDSLSPQWEVEDHGAGMSHEFMMTNYTKIFHSTKRKDNNNIGGFGHGRLSPLAYTDSYTVRSRFVGAEGVIMEGNYVVYRGPNKVPQITCVSMTKSKVAQTGVRVVVPVATKDIAVFLKKTQYFAQYLKPTPPGVKAVTYKFESPGVGGVRVMDDTYRGDENGGVRIIIGGVPYPAPPNIYGRNDLCVDLFFNVGDLEVTLSRDAINATADAVKLIDARLKQLVKDFQVGFEAELNKLKTTYEKYRYFEEYSTKAGYSFCSYFLQGMKQVTELPIADVMAAVKSDFAVHMIVSDTDRSAWDGMDNLTKSYKSLSALRIFMLNDRCEIERRDGRTSNKNIQCRDLFRHSPMENSKPLIVPFAVQLPYAQGQIKKIKDAMAKKLAEIRDKKNHTHLQCVLIQYTDKADVQAICDKLVSDLKPTFIDTGVAGAKMTRYVSILKYIYNQGRSGGSLKKVAVSENVLAKETNVLYVEKESGKMEGTYSDMLYYNLPYFPSVLKGDPTIYVINSADLKYLPAGAKKLKDAVLKAIETDFGYPYKEGQFDGAKSFRVAIERTDSYRTLAQVVKGSSTPLAAWLLKKPALVKAKPDLVPVFEAVVAAVGSKPNNSTTNTTDNLRGMLSSIIALQDARYGFLKSDELPKPTKSIVSNVPQTVDQKALQNFLEKYVLLKGICDNYDHRYYGYTTQYAEAIADYITKL